MTDSQNTNTPVGQQGVSYREAVGRPGYLIGDDGSVWTCWTRIGRGEGGGKGSRQIRGNTWRLKKQRQDRKGYMLVSFPQRGKRRTVFVHQLVLEAFVGPCPEGCESRHFPDRNPKNNTLGNLRWGTRVENAADRKLHGTDIRGNRHPLHKLSDSTVRSIRTDYANGAKQADLVRKHNVSRSVVSRIVNNKCRTELDT